MQDSPHSTEATGQLAAGGEKQAPEAELVIIRTPPCHTFRSG